MKKNRIPQQSLSTGMTFVEMIVVLALFAILSVVILNTIASFYRYNAYTIAQSYQVNFARRGVETLVRDIREMTYADDGAFPLVSKEAHRIMFYSDIDRDESVELVEYNLASTTLYKYVYDAVGSPPAYSTSTPDETYVLSEYVNNLEQGQNTFEYYDDSGALATSSVSVADIRYIDVALIINIDPIRDPGEFLLRSSASLRNLKEYDI
ncbi:MAG: prepilin-type N-terminal cleavage/methylation domain-containing protein [Candidatus Paceibacterota bacterium]